MPSVWVSLKKSLNCKTEPSHVHDPRNQSCPKSINLKDLISPSKRHNAKRQSGGSSPKSIASSEILNPMTHEVTINESTCEFQISGFGPKKGGNLGGTLKRKGTPDFGSHSARISNSRIISGYNVGNFVKSKGFHGRGCYNGFSYLKNFEAVEEHHHFHHSVQLTELAEGDSSRKIVELICGPNLSKQICTVLQVNNTQTTLSQFEAHRATVKTRATTHQYPRCMADGNELLRFHGATVACSLGRSGHARPCTLRSCGVCNILTRGFSSTQKHGGFGVFTACRSERALEMVGGGDDRSARRGLVVCRVIAGRVRRAGDHEKVMGLEGFDSLAGGLGHDHESKSVEELYLLDPRALLACFVVICRG